MPTPRVGTARSTPPASPIESSPDDIDHFLSSLLPHDCSILSPIAYSLCRKLNCFSRQQKLTEAAAILAPLNDSIRPDGIREAITITARCFDGAAAKDFHELFPRNLADVAQAGRSV